jgi:hypothetical protein
VNVDLEDLLRAGQLEKVEVGLLEAERDLHSATQHLASAQQIHLTDPLGSFQLSYDSARKCLQGLLALEGVRVRKPPRGSHYTFVLVSRSAIVDQEAWRPLNWMRELRNSSEYLDRSSSPASLEDALQALEIVRRMLADTQKRYPNKPDITPDQP